MLSQYSVLLIDCDGTLVPKAELMHEACVERTLQKLHQAHTVSYDREEFHKVWMAGLGKGIGPFYYQYLTHVPGLHEKLGNDIDVLVEMFEAAYEKAYIDFVQIEKPELRHGMQDLITESKKHGLPVAIVSNANQAVLEATVYASGVRGIDLIIGKDTVEDQGYQAKPEPGSYLYACDLLGVDVRKAIGLEDSPSGYKSLQNAGVALKIFCQNTVDATHYNGTGRMGYDDPDLVVSTLDHLFEKLHGLLTNRHQQVAPKMPAIPPNFAFSEFQPL